LEFNHFDTNYRSFRLKDDYILFLGGVKFRDQRILIGNSIAKALSKFSQKFWAKNRFNSCLIERQKSNSDSRFCGAKLKRLWESIFVAHQSVLITEMMPKRLAALLDWKKLTKNPMIDHHDFGYFD